MNIKPIIFGSLLLSFSLVGCKKDDEENPQPQPLPESTETADRNGNNLLNNVDFDGGNFQPIGEDSEEGVGEGVNVL